MGTTSTFVPECGKETPDRLAVTVERTVASCRGGQTPGEQDHNNRAHRGEEQNHMDRPGDYRGGGENHRHSIGATGHNNHRVHTVYKVHRREEGDHTMVVGGGGAGG